MILKLTKHRGVWELQPGGGSPSLEWECWAWTEVSGPLVPGETIAMWLYDSDWHIRSSKGLPNWNLASHANFFEGMQGSANFLFVVSPLLVGRSQPGLTEPYALGLTSPSTSTPPPSRVTTIQTFMVINPFLCASRGYSSLRCVGFSLQWLLLLRSIGSRHAGFSSCSTQPQ